MLRPGSYTTLLFRDRSGQSPFLEWLKGLDAETQLRISARVDRMKRGQFGDYKAIDGSLYELRLFFGPGYRVYFANRRGITVIILAGGDKSSQNRDIKRARQYLKLYLEDNP